MTKHCRSVSLFVVLILVSFSQIKDAAAASWVPAITAIQSAIPGVKTAPSAINPVTVPTVDSSLAGNKCNASLMSIQETVIGQPFDPCEEKIAVQATVRLTKDAFLNAVSACEQQLKNAKVADREASLRGKPISLAQVTDGYEVNLELNFYDSKNNLLATKKTETLLSLSAFDHPVSHVPGEASVILNLAWDGLSDFKGAPLIIAGNGAYVKGHVALVKKWSDKNFIPQRTVMEDKPLPVQNIQVNSPSSQCQAWSKLVPSLAKGADQKVIVHGRSSSLTPSITYRGSKPVMIFGDMGQTGKGDCFLAAKNFLKANQSLFSNSSLFPSSADLLKVDVKNGVALINKDPDNTTRVILRQFYNAVPVQDSRLTAVCDSAGELVFLGGQIKDDLPSGLPPPPRLTPDKALKVVADDIARKRLSAARPVGVAGTLLVVKDRTGRYIRAYQVGVGTDKHETQEDPKTAFLALKYVVSAEDGSILSVEIATAFEMATLNILSHDPVDDAFKNNNICAGVPDPRLTCGNVSYASEKEYGMGINEPSWGHSVLSNSDFVAGVVHKMEVEGKGEPQWNSSRLTLSGAGNITRDEALRAETAFYQMSNEWMSYSQFYITRNAWDDVDVDIDSAVPSGLGAVGFYQSDSSSHSISLSPIYLGSDFGYLDTPSHELFHHFDNQTVDIFSGSVSDTDTYYAFLPLLIKESSANIMAQVMSTYHPDNSLSLAAGAVLCLFDGAHSYNDCLALFKQLYFTQRTPDTIVKWMRCVDPRTTNLFEPWEDLRSTDDSGCYLLNKDDINNWTGNADDEKKKMLFQHEFLAETLQDLWDTSSHSDAQADRFSHTFLKAYMMLERKPDLIEFREALKIAYALFANSTTGWPDPAVYSREINNAFARHGVDATIEQFCGDASTRDKCHN